LTTGVLCGAAQKQSHGSRVAFKHFEFVSGLGFVAWDLNKSLIAGLPNNLSGLWQPGFFKIRIFSFINFFVFDIIS
jgi:hypothetical protein